VTDLLAEFRARNHEARQADYAKRKVSGTPKPPVLDPDDRYAERLRLESAASGLNEVVKAMEGFAGGTLDAQVMSKIAAQSRESREQMLSRPQRRASSR
jgi:hypothetical protein